MKDFRTQPFRRRRNASQPVRRDKRRAGGSAALPKETEKKEQKEKEPKPAIEQAEAVRLVYRIQEGPQTRVRRVLIGGYKHTRWGVIHREVHIKVKEPLREGDVVESQRRLYNLGVFNRAPSSSESQRNKSGEGHRRSVEEAKRYTVAYGGDSRCKGSPARRARRGADPSRPREFLSSAS